MPAWVDGQRVLLFVLGEPQSGDITILTGWDLMIMAGSGQAKPAPLGAVCSSNGVAN
ncbi:MAG: hypothetical protein ACJAUL_002329 [Paraglaciecola sp.]|jgi:hypothetical protein